MQLSDGPHTLTTEAKPAGPGGVPPAEPSTSVTYHFDAAGMHTTWNGVMHFVAAPPPGFYTDDEDTVVRFFDETPIRFIATHAGKQTTGTST